MRAFILLLGLVVVKGHPQEKCQKEGKNCAQDLNPVTKCCEEGLECQIEPNGWGSCEKKTDKQVYSEAYGCSYKGCNWNNGEQGKDWGYYSTTNGDCTLCMNECDKDKNCEGVECGGDHCSWWKNGKCDEAHEHTLPSNGVDKMCVKKRGFRSTGICKKDECWCVSAGGTSCSYPKSGICQPDECWDEKTCPGNGYWCDDRDIQGSEEGECSSDRDCVLPDICQTTRAGTSFCLDSGSAFGRPFSVQGRFRKSTSQTSNAGKMNHGLSWRTGLMPIVLGNISLNQEMGRRWLQQAEGEHASVASFARHTLQLMAIGAPSGLLAASQEASVDEIRHAKICYGIASAFLGSNFGPGPLDIEGSLERMDLKEITQSIIQEGCIEETISAVEAHLGAYTAQDPNAKAALTQIAIDETRHAQLAWDTIQWITERFPEMRSFVTETFRAELESRALALEKNLSENHISTNEDQHMDSVFQSYGLVVMKDRNMVRQITMQDIIKPVYIRGWKDVSIISKKITKLEFGFLQ